MNVKKKVIIHIVGILIIISLSIGITGCRLSEINRQRIIDANELGIDNLRELEKQRNAIDRGFERTITEQGKLLIERQGIIDQRQRELETREFELERTNAIIERLSSNTGSSSESIGRLRLIHRELEKRDSETRD